MKLKFWGVRGSITTPEVDKLKVGGNTSCIEIDAGERKLIFDAGTGIRELGRVLAKDIISSKIKELNIFLSHTHWDHIQGIPFFAPVYFQDIQINIFGPYKANRKLENLISNQMEYDYFPVKFNHLPAKIKFYELNEGTHKIFDDIYITCKKHIHPGIAYGYRIDYNGKSIVYSTDTEHFQNSLDKRVIELSEASDILIHDAQYTNDEINFRLGWGHSTWKQAIEISKIAKVKYLFLFHHDPDRTDISAFNIENEAKKEFENTFLAIEKNEYNI